MKILPVLGALFLVGCPAASNPRETKEPTPPSPQSPRSVENGLVPGNVLSDTHSYEGVWSTLDDQGQPFDILLFPKSQAVTTWTKGLPGARGERGFWRKEKERLIVVYDDGWTDIITSSADGMHHAGYAPGSPIEGTPSNTAPISRVSAPQADFVGVWRLNKEPDGSYQYIALQSSGRAVSTINGGTEGHWTIKGNAALCTWPDGWIDLLERGPEGWQKRSWVGTATESSLPADFSPALRVGESPFLISP